MSLRLKASLVIFVLASAVRLSLIFGLHRYEIGRPEPVRISEALVSRGAFADPHPIPTGPTAHIAPFYPSLIACLRLVWKHSPEADLARMASSALTASAEYAMLPAVAVALGLGMWPGFLAGLAGALLPLHYWPECMGEFETVWIALFLEAATIAFAHFLRKPQFDFRRGALSGLLWGIGFLIAPNVLPVLAAFLAIGWWKLRPRSVDAARWLAAFAGTVLLVLTPWTVRNYIQLGGLFFVRDNIGLELFLSNHDDASPNALDNLSRPYWAKSHPHASAEVDREISRTGELAFERRMLSQALAWIREHPGQFLVLTAARIRAFWFPWVPRFRWAYWIVSLAALPCLVLLLVRARFAGLILFAVLMSYPVTYYITQNTLRYQHPVWWALLLTIAAGLSSLWHKLQTGPGWTSRPTPTES